MLYLCNSFVTKESDNFVCEFLILNRFFFETIMNNLELIFLISLLITSTFHILTFYLGYSRSKRQFSSEGDNSTLPSISIVRPVCGLEEIEKTTLESTFHLNYRNYEILFCVADDLDPSIEFLKNLIENHPHVKSKLLIGESNSTINPKLNNILKGWSEALYDFVVLADSNVLMPKDYLQRLLHPRDNETGLICSPPVGSYPKGFWAEVECSFLNTYQARWQLAADSVGFGFAQGKSMLWRKSELETSGGISALARDIAEDAAATKIVREVGKKVRLVDRPFCQLLGYRSFTQVWDRQIRWARLRRVTFPIYFIPELFSGSLLPIISFIFLVCSYQFSSAVFLVLCFSMIWFGFEGIYARIFGWHMSFISPIAWIMRDILIPFIWFYAWAGNNFIWRGNVIDIKEQKITSHTHLSMFLNT